MAHRSRSTALALAAALLLSAALAPRLVRGQAQQATVMVDGPVKSASAAAGDIQLNIDVKDAQNLAGFQFVLSFDSNLLHPVSVAKTDFLGKTGREIYCQDPTIEPAAVRYTCVTLRPEPAGVDGQGTLAVVTLKPTGNGSGTSAVTLSRVKLVHPDGSELPSRTVDGKLSVGGSGGGFPWWAAVLIAVAVAAAVLVAALLWRRRSRARGVIGPDAGDLGSDPA